MKAIYKRELAAYFTSPIGYIFMAVYLALSGAVFVFTTLYSASSNTGMYFMLMIFLYIILIPLLTMKLLSEERKLKTEQILLTSPISLFEMVFAKFLAAFTLFSGTFVIGCLEFGVLYLYSDSVNTASMVSGALGVLFLGGAFIAIGLFVSSLTENQLVSAILSIFSIFVMLAMGLVSQSIEFAPLRILVKWLSVFDRYSDFSYGLFSLGAIFYYVSIIVAFLFLTVRIYEKRRWE
ncbi:MAG: ABC transporter permease subunit [Clostridia bacterium]|nr:ABC transporter permease subunit [Clostridia bacterium]